MPHRTQLISLVDSQQISPALDPRAFPGTPSAYFWSATPPAGSSSNA
ncbi:MAG: DUF1566 domain-containing protein [Myxococcales bacterium]|nr:DUF1566 domain-containing protein [Myxococcales bacterium]